MVLVHWGLGYQPYRRLSACHMSIHAQLGCISTPVLAVVASAVVAAVVLACNNGFVLLLAGQQLWLLHLSIYLLFCNTVAVTTTLAIATSSVATSSVASTSTAFTI